MALWLKSCTNVQDYDPDSDEIKAYLHGDVVPSKVRGWCLVRAGGYSIGQSMERKPSEGRSVTLTIDLDLQKACESALSETIAQIGSASAGSARFSTS